MTLSVYSHVLFCTPFKTVVMKGTDMWAYEIDSIGVGSSPCPITLQW